MTKETRTHIVFIAIMIVSFSLHIIKIDQEKLGNHYYTAATKNMLSSPRNFFFGSLDSQGFVTVDKPPAGLWIQALFLFLFGVNSYSIMLPSIIAGTLSVFLLYLIVSKSFGQTAGLSAAFILAITPVSVALSRNNTMDAMLICVLLLAIWFFQRALENKKLGDFLYTAVLIGFAFNIKMLQALVILPALFVVFLLYYRPKLPKKILHTAIIALVLITVSLFWAFIVEITPEDQRPFISGSPTNSALDLMINYNGIYRIGGINDPSLAQQKNYFETGEPGLFRLFNPLIGGQSGWFIPFALLGALLYLGIILKNNADSVKEKRDLLFWGIWFVVVFLYLSLNTGFIHIHYIAMLSPAIAALGGIAVKGCLTALKQGGLFRWIVPGILLLSLFSQWLLSQAFPKWNQSMSLALIVISLLAIGIMAFIFVSKKQEKGLSLAFFGSFLSLAVFPFAWSLTPIFYGGDPAIPYARPDLKDLKISETYFQVNNRNKPEFQKLLAFLNKKRKGEKFLLGVQSALAEGSNLLLATEGDVMCLGGFSGTDPILTPSELAAYIDSGIIRYFLLTLTGAYLNETIAWVTRNGKIVLNSEWKQGDQFSGFSLYDCRPEQDK